MNVLVTRRIHSSAIEMLKAAGLSVTSFETNEPLNKSYLEQNLSNFDAVLSCVSDKIDRSIIKKAVAGKLKIISNMAVGLDNIDVKYAKECGIKVFNTPGVVSGPTADMTIALAFTLLRKISNAHQFVIAGHWKSWDPEIFLGRNFDSLTWGIIGYGNIGKILAKRLQGFEMNIIYFDPAFSENDQYSTAVSINELLNQSDVISLHVPLTKETENFIDLEKLKAMKKTAVLVNMARGGVINSSDLIVALRNKIISAAALDVFTPEPIPADNEILTLDNVILSPHIGTATIECRKEMAEMAAGNIINNL
jgi:glyoxylate reductase